MDLIVGHSGSLVQVINVYVKYEEKYFFTSDLFLTFSKGPIILNSLFSFFLKTQTSPDKILTIPNIFEVNKAGFKNSEMISPLTLSNFFLSEVVWYLLSADV